MALGEWFGRAHRSVVRQLDRCYLRHDTRLIHEAVLGDQRSSGVKLSFELREKDWTKKIVVVSARRDEDSIQFLVSAKDLQRFKQDIDLIVSRL